jgi:TRAP-type C4-dicarboxylate transport system permease large subunit
MVAGPFTWLSGVGNVGILLQNFLTSFITNPLVFIFIVMIVLLILGMIMESSVIQLLVTPILAPIALSYGLDPIHFGLIVIITLLVGCLTPPFGTLLFVMMDMEKMTLMQMFKAVAPFYFPYLAFIVVIALIPVITTFLPNLFG